VTNLEVATARRLAMAARADRPSQRRSQEEAGSRALVRATVSGLEVRAKDDGAGLQFLGYASVVERAYDMWDMFGPYSEIVSADAFDATLAREGLDVPFVIAHDQTRRIARTTNGTLRLSMDDSGLLVDADLDPTDADVAYIVPKLRAGLIDEMSFAFRIDSGQWSPDYDEFRINKVDMHRGDVAIVGFGANPYTSGGMRSAALPARRSGEQAITARDLTDPWA
jgi:HK97 family phage prohead protease